MSNWPQEAEIRDKWLGTGDLNTTSGIAHFVILSG